VRRARTTRARGRASGPRAEGDTRRRLIASARERFAEDGFWAASVRDICRAAGANVAAVNYHFGDKLGLYREVVTEALAAVGDLDPTIDAPPGSSAADRIRHYVRSYLPRIAKPDEKILSAQRLMTHELETPTPLAPWIAERVIVPRLNYLAQAVAELLGCPVSDPRVDRCVMSLQAQCLFHRPNRFARAALPARDAAMRADLDAAVDHVVAFTLAGIAHLAKEQADEG
jgi:TetR/AcrR family transcriptional regulator, regulator of cefoperazone and chloramphenicol sensitivity